MTARSSLHVAGRVTSAEDARLAQAAAWAKDGISVRTGVVFAGVTELLTPTATMDVQVAPLHFVSSKTDTEGVYVGANDGVEPVTIAAAPGAGTRTDKIYVMQKDANLGVTSPDATTEPFIGVTSGGLPPGAVEVGTVTVPAGATKLTDAGVVVKTTCRWTTTAGAPIPVRDRTERDAIPAGEGLRAMRLDMDCAIDVFTGGAWVDGDTGWVAPTMADGWTSSPLYPLEIRRQGTKVKLRGGVVRGAGAGNPLCVAPAGFRPPANRLLGACVASSGAVVTPNVATTGTVAITYQTTGVAQGATLPIDVDWTTD